MKDVVTKYAIAIGDDWFGGFSYRNREQVVIRGSEPKLLDHTEVKLALSDLRKCDFLGEVYKARLEWAGKEWDRHETVRHT